MSLDAYFCKIMQITQVSIPEFLKLWQFLEKLLLADHIL